MIILADKSHAEIVAALHERSISEGFLSKLGGGFLASLYSFLIKNELVLVYKEECRVLGFISCAFTSRGIMKRFLVSSPYGIIKLMFVFLKSPKLLKPLLETMHAPSLSGSMKEMEIPETELLSVAVSDQVQNGGIGTALLLALEEELIKRDIKIYKVVAGDKLEGANKFYKKNGFVLVKRIRIHNNEISNVYVKFLY